MRLSRRGNNFTAENLKHSDTDRPTAERKSQSEFLHSAHTHTYSGCGAPFSICSMTFPFPRFYSCFGFCFSLFFTHFIREFWSTRVALAVTRSARALQRAFDFNAFASLRRMRSAENIQTIFPLPVAPFRPTFTEILIFIPSLAGFLSAAAAFISISKTFCTVNHCDATHFLHSCISAIYLPDTSRKIVQIIALYFLRSLLHCDDSTGSAPVGVKTDAKVLGSTENE